MTENYTKVFSLEENLYTEGSPLVIKSGALYKEKNNGSIVAQLELHSVSDKPIIAVKVEILCTFITDLLR